ncbi:MAG: hypothetical protein ABI333_08355 [bacterium]
MAHKARTPSRLFLKVTLGLIDENAIAMSNDFQVAMGRAVGGEIAYSGRLGRHVSLGTGMGLRSLSYIDLSRQKRGTVLFDWTLSLHIIFPIRVGGRDWFEIYINGAAGLAMAKLRVLDLGVGFVAQGTAGLQINFARSFGLFFDVGYRYTGLWFGDSENYPNYEGKKLWGQLAVNAGLVFTF